MRIRSAASPAETNMKSTEKGVTIPTHRRHNGGPEEMGTREKLEKKTARVEALTPSRLKHLPLRHTAIAYIQNQGTRKKGTNTNHEGDCSHEEEDQRPNS